MPVLTKVSTGIMHNVLKNSIGILLMLFAISLLSGGLQQLTSDISLAPTPNSCFLEVS